MILFEVGLPPQCIFNCCVRTFGSLRMPHFDSQYYEYYYVDLKYDLTLMFPVLWK